VQNIKKSEKDIEEVDYKRLIVEMIEKINDKEFLEMIYGFVKRLYKEESGSF